jgi:hypothetical protein
MIICGTVPVSSVARNPYLKRLPEPRIDTRTYELRYAEGATPEPTVRELVTHEEWNVPEYVRWIRIKLENDEDVVIESHACSEPHGNRHLLRDAMP